MAGFFSEELISEIISANDIIDIVSGYVRLKRAGSSYMGCCPFHREKTPSFHVSADKQLYHCFGCGAGGSVIQFVMNAEGLDFQDAVRYLAERAGIRIPEDGAGESDDKHLRRKRIYELNRDAARFFRECLLSEKGKEAQQYLTNRGLSGKTIAAFGLGFAPNEWDGLLKKMLAMGYTRELLTEAGLCIINDKGRVYDRFRGRVMYPIIDVRGNIIGFGGRIMSGDGAKYMNSPESIVYDKGKNLFALNIAKKSKRGYYILVEGYMDVISLHQAGFDAAVAGCGTALTEHQARLISKSPVYLCYDSDEAGMKACARAAEIFKKFDTKVRVISIPKAKDADEFIKKYGGNAFEQLIEKASAFTQYQLDSLLKNANLDDTAQKIDVINRAAQLLAKVYSSVEREIYINNIAARTGISAEAINKEIRKINGRNVRNEVSGELRKTVSSKTSSSVGEASSRRKSAEAGFLAQMCENASVYEKFADKVSDEIFSSEVHKEIFLLICKYYGSGEKGACSEYLTVNLREKERELSKVLLSAVNVENPIDAACDFLDVIENEIFNERLQKAQAEGDISMIARLLKEKKQKGGRIK